MLPQTTKENKPNFNDFLLWEHASRDTIDFKKIYVDIAGDLIAGLLLSQVVYWYLPNDQGQTKLRVEKDKQLWIAKGRDEWYDEIRISPKQFDRAVNILIKKGIIIKSHFRFDGLRTNHIRLDYDRFMELWQAELNSGLPQRSTPVFPKGQLRSSPKVNSGLPQRSRPLTETTTETTTEINNLSNDKLAKKNAKPIPKPKTELMNEFISVTGIPIPNYKTDCNYWWSRIGAIYKAVGEDVVLGKALIRDAVDKLTEDQMTISDPGSIYKTVVALKSQRNGSNPNVVVIE